MFSLYFLSPKIDLPTAQEHLSFYKQTKIRSCKTMVVFPRDFMEDSYSFSSKTLILKVIMSGFYFCLFENWIQAWGNNSIVFSFMGEFFFQSYLSGLGILSKSLWIFQHKHTIHGPESCKDYANLPLETNLTWFGGLELNIHWLEGFPLINLNMLM